MYQTESIPLGVSDPAKPCLTDSGPEMGERLAGDADPLGMRSCVHAGLSDATMPLQHDLCSHDPRYNVGPNTPARLRWAPTATQSKLHDPNHQQAEAKTDYTIYDTKSNGHRSPVWAVWCPHAHNKHWTSAWPSVLPPALLHLTECDLGGATVG